MRLTGSGSGPPSASGPAAKTLRTMTLPRRSPGPMPASSGENGKATRVRSHGRVRQRACAGDLDAVDDDAGLAFAGAEEEAVAGEDDRIVDVELRAVVGVSARARARACRRCRRDRPVGADSRTVPSSAAIDCATAVPSKWPLPDSGPGGAGGDGAGVACRRPAWPASVSSTEVRAAAGRREGALEDQAGGGARGIGEARADEIDASTTAARSAGCSSSTRGRGQAVVEPGQLRRASSRRPARAR